MRPSLAGRTLTMPARSPVASRLVVRLTRRDRPPGPGGGGVPLGFRRGCVGANVSPRERPLLAPSVTVWAHTVFPELRADRPYHQPGEDSRLPGSRPPSGSGREVSGP